MRIIIFTVLLLAIPISLFSNKIDWKLVNSNTQNNLTILYFLNDNVGYACGFSGTVLKTTDAGETWNHLAINSYSTFSKIYFVDSLRAWIGGQKSISKSPSEVLYYTDDGGISWTAKPIPSISTVTGIYFFDNDNGLVTNIDGNIYRTTDNGSNWEIIYQTNFLTKGIKKFNNLIWIYGYFGNIITSSDKGLSWTKSSNFPTNINVYGMTRTEGGNIWISGNDGAIYSSTDNGSTWEKSNSNTNDYLWTIDFFDDENGLYGGGWDSSILAATSDGGVTWELQNIPTNNYIGSIKIISQNRIVAVGKAGTILIGEKQKTDISENKYIENNNLIVYPNPNRENNINLKISLETNSNIKLDLINSLGIIVGKSFTDYLNSDTHTIQYKPDANLPSGTYWLRMTMNNKETIVKPVVIMR